VIYHPTRQQRGHFISYKGKTKHRGVYITPKLPVLVVLPCRSLQTCSAFSLFEVTPLSHYPGRQINPDTKQKAGRCNPIRQRCPDKRLPFYRIPESFTLLQHHDCVAGRQEDAIRAGQGESECLWIIQIYMDGISTLFAIVLLPLQAVNTAARERLVIGQGFELPDCGSGQEPELLASDRRLPCLHLILKGIVIRWIVSKALKIKEQGQRVDAFLMDCS
jgi:hypothetical protein